MELGLREARRWTAALKKKKRGSEKGKKNFSKKKERQMRKRNGGGTPARSGSSDEDGKGMNPVEIEDLLSSFAGQKGQTLEEFRRAWDTPTQARSPTFKGCDGALDTIPPNAFPEATSTLTARFAELVIKCRRGHWGRSACYRQAQQHEQ